MQNEDIKDYREYENVQKTKNEFIENKSFITNEKRYSINPFQIYYFLKQQLFRYKDNKLQKELLKGNITEKEYTEKSEKLFERFIK